ncbi:hypothetical protein HG530_015407 [Fusarium avenaceum]|nr:hypothetical protein HG530_015407 [Fusarium avenaceum]
MGVESIDEEECDDDALRDLNAVDAREHIDALGTEHGNAGHVYIVESAQVEELAEIRLQLERQDNGRNVKVDKVNNEKRDRGETGNPPFVSPTNVKEQTALVDILRLKLNDDISISAATGSRNNILVEGKGDEHNDGEEIDGSAHSAHALWNFSTLQLAHVPTAEASAHKRRAQPAYHGVAKRKAEDRERKRCNEGFPIATEGVREDGEANA